MKGETATAKPMKIPPTLSVTDKDLPAIKDWSVGKIYTITAVIKQVSMSKGDHYGMSEGEGYSARFEIVSIKPIGPQNTGAVASAMKRSKHY